MIYLIITTSINNKNGNKNLLHRKERYIDSIKNILTLLKNDLSIKSIIVENNGTRPTYLDNLQCDIVYTNNNKLQFSHKGVNELLDIKEVINQYKIKDDDIIIKLTGRYKILDLMFINIVKNNIDIYDAFIKFFNVCTLKYMTNDCVLGLFAIKSKYLKKFKYNCIKSPECEFADFVRQNITKIMEINNLNLECCFADNLSILNV
jgi:hypothetical protein